MHKDTLIIVITKNSSIYDNTNFKTDVNFFNNDFNFCFIDDTTRNYKLYHADTKYKDEDDFLNKIHQSGILMVYDKSDIAGASPNFGNIFEVLNKAINTDLNLYLWCHTSTYRSAEENINKYYLSANNSLLGLEQSSHSGHQNEIYTHIPSYEARNIELEEIITRCYKRRKKKRIFQDGLSTLFSKLDKLSYNNDILKVDEHQQDFISHRNNLIHQLHE